MLARDCRVKGLMVPKLASILFIHLFLAYFLELNFFFIFQDANQLNTLIPFRRPQYAVKIFYLFFFLNYFVNQKF